MFGGGVGPMEIFLVLIVVLLIFGPKRLPGLGRQLGRGMKEFRESITDRHDREDDEEDAPAALGRPEAAPPVAPDAPAPAPEPATTEAAPASDVSRPPR
jgi:sec-independent protein translocase protein TatA